jgi:hypothetical protein
MVMTHRPRPGSRELSHEKPWTNTPWNPIPWYTAW